MHLSKLAVEVLCRADHTIKNVDLPKTRDRKKGLSLYELLITTNMGSRVGMDRQNSGSTNCDSGSVV